MTIEISIKGAAGSGKSTIAHLIQDYLINQGFNSMLIEQFDEVNIDQDLLHTRAKSLKEQSKLIKVKTVQTHRAEQL